MEIVNLKSSEKYLREYIEICSKEWGTKCDVLELKIKIDKKAQKILSNKNNNLILALGLIDNKTLVGFISLFKTDGEERTDLTPWYGTMYVKEEFRGNGYSKILNSALLKEASNLGYNRVYLKTTLINYYEKFNAIFYDKLSNSENIYFIELH